MALRTVIHDTLQAAPAVTALLGVGATLRHYPVRAPQGVTTPYLVSQIVASRAADTHGSGTDGEDTMDEALVQFTALAADNDSALAILQAVRAAFLDPTVTAARAVLDTARVVCTAPELREGSADEVEGLLPTLELTFFHNPST